MKKTFYLCTILASFAFMSCSKEKKAAVNNSTTATVKYDFTTDKAGNFSAEFSTDTSMAGEPISSLTWSKTVIVTRQNSVSHTASLTIHPPFEWTTTADQANVVIKISVDGVEKASNSGLMGGVDHPAGLTATVPY